MSDQTAEQLLSHLDGLQGQLAGFQESIQDLSSYVDPAEAMLGPDGTIWGQVGSGALGASEFPYTTEQQLTAIRQQSRRLASTNEYAIGCLQNRSNFIVGSGFEYIVEPKAEESVPEGLVDQTQEIIDRFLKANRWGKRQQEIILRTDRDGEVFLRYFATIDGLLVRFVEPAYVKQPTDSQGPQYTFGVETDPDDVETVLAYWIEGERVEAGEIQHRKSGTDSSMKRGLPLLYPTRANLTRVEKMLRNMAAVTEIQSAIAMIRKHVGQISSGVKTFADNVADATYTNPSTGKVVNFQQFAPGTILDTTEAREYEFPAAKVDPSKPVAAIQACLRATAAGVVMPEFMLTADASNANYASTMIAEGPAVKNFERLQADQIEYDSEIMVRVIEAAEQFTLLPEGTRNLVEVRIEPPSLAVRDQLKEAQKDSILYTGGILSPQTWSSRDGLDYEQEQAAIDEHNESTTGTSSRSGGRSLPPAAPGEDQGDNGGREPAEVPAEEGASPPECPEGQLIECLDAIDIRHRSQALGVVLRGCCESAEDTRVTRAMVGFAKHLGLQPAVDHLESILQR